MKYTYSYYFPQHLTGCFGFDSIQSAYNEASSEDLAKNGAYFLIGIGEHPKGGWKEPLYDSRNGELSWN